MECLLSHLDYFLKDVLQTDVAQHAVEDISYHLVVHWERGKGGKERDEGGEGGRRVGKQTMMAAHSLLTSLWFLESLYLLWSS